MITYRTFAKKGSTNLNIIGRTGNRTVDASLPPFNFYTLPALKGALREVVVRVDGERIFTSKSLNAVGDKDCYNLQLKGDAVDTSAVAPTKLYTYNKGSTTPSQYGGTYTIKPVTSTWLHITTPSEMYNYLASLKKETGWIVSSTALSGVALSLASSIYAGYCPLKSKNGICTLIPSGETIAHGRSTLWNGKWAIELDVWTTTIVEGQPWNLEFHIMRREGYTTSASFSFCPQRAYDSYNQNPLGVYRQTSNTFYDGVPNLSGGTAVRALSLTYQTGVIAADAFGEGVRDGLNSMSDSTFLTWLDFLFNQEYIQLLAWNGNHCPVIQAMKMTPGGFFSNGTLSFQEGSTFEERQEIIKMISREVYPLALSAEVLKDSFLQTSTQWGERVNDALSNINPFTSNALAYLADLKSVSDTLKSVYRLTRDPTNPKKWAAAWLSARFGDRLFVKDTLELVSAIDTQLEAAQSSLASLAGWLTTSTRWLESGSNPYRTEIISSYVSSGAYKIYYAPSDITALQKAVRKCLEWDAWPSMENLWDLVPMSFVLDWILPVSDFLSHLDMLIQKLYYYFFSVCKSQRIEAYFGKNLTKSIARSGRVVYSNLRFVYYERKVRSELDYAPFRADLCLPSSVNVIDGLSLFLQLL